MEPLKSMHSCATLKKMKKTIAGLLFLFLSAQAAPSHEIRAMTGLIFSKYLFSGEIDSLNRQQKLGSGIGVGWAFDLSPNMKLEVDALFNTKGAKTELQYAPGKTILGIYKNTSLAFPILCKYRLRKTASPYAALGPEFVFILSHYLTFPESGDTFNVADVTKKLVLAFNILLGYELPIGKWGLFAEIRYNRCLSNFFIDPEATVKCEAINFLLGGVYYL